MHGLDVLLGIIEPTSLASGFFITAALSSLFAVMTGLVWQSRLAFLLVLVSAFLIAHGLYKLPVWRGAEPYEYSSWYFLFVGFWFIAGAGASWIALVVTRSVRSQSLRNRRLK